MQSASSGVMVVKARSRRRKYRRWTTGHLVWSGLLRVLQRITHYKHGDKLEFKISFSVRDLLGDKRRAVKDQVEALLQAVQKAGSYQAKDDAARAVHAVLDALKDRVPSDDVLSKLSESLPGREAARLRRAAAQRLQKENCGVNTTTQGDVEGRMGGAKVGEVSAAAPDGSEDEASTL